MGGRERYRERAQGRGRERKKWIESERESKTGIEGESERELWVLGVGIVAWVVRLTFEVTAANPPSAKAKS